jgi:hypothetical protein
MQTDRTNEQLHNDQIRLLDMINTDLVSGLSRFTVEHADGDDDLAMQTVAVAVPTNGSSALPILVIDIHANDDEAMKYSVAVFEAMKSKGLISSQQAARYRRSLFALVPSAA